MIKLQFIHFVNSHGSKTAKKIIKRWYYPPSRRLNVNVMLSNITFLWCFCSFWSMAVNTFGQPCVGIMLDAEVTMSTHVSSVVSASFAALRRIHSVRRSILWKAGFPPCFPISPLVSRNSATTKHPIWKLEFQVYRVALFAWSYVTGVWQKHRDEQTDGQTHDDGMYRA